jgi:hypothetical protein
MNAAYRSKKLARMAFVLLLIVTERSAMSQQTVDPMAPVAATSPSQLRWTPHRGATGQRSDAVAPPARQPAPAFAAASPAPAPLTTAQPMTAQPMAAQPVISQPSTAAILARTPSSVGLPEGVPPIGTTPTQLPANSNYAPLRGRFPTATGEWISPNRIAGNFLTAFNPDDPNALFGNGLMRSPQGDNGRPIMAQEGMQRRPQPRTAVVGDAPRFNPASARYNPAAPQFNPNPNMLRPAAPRRDRTAMNVDAMPSVMTRGPQAATIAGAANKSQAPVTQGLPAPTSAPPSAVESIDPSMMMMNSMPMEMQGSAPGGYDPQMSGGYDPQMSGGYDPQMMMPGDDGLLMGQYPSQLHVESFYDDPYACEEEIGVLPLCLCDGRLCAWMRQFGRPYYGWRWYRDFTASAGVTSFQNTTDLGLHGNYGVNEYANWAMPFWNAFGIGWQLGVRGVQADFQSAAVKDPTGATIFDQESRNQVFVTTGFFTRAFEGRGLQFGAVYDYLRDSWYDDVDVAQVRGEISYVWGYHEFGFWGAASVADTNGVFSSGSKANNYASTLDLYTGFYRLHFGDANELKVWGGASGSGDGLVGTLVRAPMGRSLALEGTFTYLFPGSSNTVTLPTKDTLTYSEQAWNMSVNLVFYPAGRSRRSLASPYRPLFDVADNGSMIRSIAIPKP